ncbi:MAG: NAD(P)/FAD-dependent oxidoreductase [Cyanobium sp.]
MARERFFLELPPPQDAMAAWPHVVIVGGGFAGVKAALALAGEPLRVTLIDKRNFTLFQPLLYQVASGLVSEADVATPLRRLLERAANVQVLLGEVSDLNPAAREVVFHDRRYRYDHLILATGSGSSYFGHEEWRPQAPPMKILEHADEIRRRLLSAFEEAEQTPDPERRRVLQSVVVIGGGPSGCELAGSLSELSQHSIRRFFRQVDPTHSRIVLVDPGDRLLRAMDPTLSTAAEGYLRGRGVELLLGGRVQSIASGKVTISVKGPEGKEPEQRVIEAATVCWTAGVRASHLGGLLAERTGCTVDRGGRVVVEPDFSIPGHPEIRVVGDLCSYSHTVDGKPLPGMAGPAVQMGGWVARDILARVQGQTHAAFRWTDLGSMAVIGPLFAVADLRGLKVTGKLGWLLWGVAHLGFMPAMENRVTLLIKWLWSIGIGERSSLLITGRPNQHMDVEVGLERFEALAAEPLEPLASAPAA